MWRFHDAAKHCPPPTPQSSTPASPHPPRRPWYVWAASMARLLRRWAPWRSSWATPTLPGLILSDQTPRFQQGGPTFWCFFLFFFWGGGGGRLILNGKGTPRHFEGVSGLRNPPLGAYFFLLPLELVESWCQAHCLFF